MKSSETQLTNIIEKLHPNHSFSDNFDSFLDFCLFFFFANPTEEQQKKFSENRMNPKYTEALELLGEASEGYHDSLGDMFMYRISHGNNGQFFTPEPICDFMAKIVDGTGESVCDPTCGSGRFLLKGLRQSREGHQLEPTLYGCDLDLRCAKMTLLNLCLNSARGDVEWGNSLTMEIYRTYHIDRVMIAGKYMSYVWQYTPNETDMDALNNEREKVIQYLRSNGILYERPITCEAKEVKPQESEEIPPITEPERKEPVQLELMFE